VKDLIRKILRESEDDFEWAKDLVSSVSNVDLSQIEGLKDLDRSKNYIIWVEDLPPESIEKIFNFIESQKKWLSNTFMEREDFNNIKRKASIIFIHPPRNQWEKERSGIGVWTHEHGSTQRELYEELVNKPNTVEINPYHILAQM